jgi:hypothetical protein
MDSGDLASEMTGRASVLLAARYTQQCINELVADWD